jgi:hypothetical protein
MLHATMSRSIQTAVKSPQHLINAANKHDRFHLLTDPSAPKPDLCNRIHPIFSRSNFSNACATTYKKLHQPLQLASKFLEYDSVLEWFVAPLLGLPLLDSQSGKTYLSDPLSNKSSRERHKLIAEVRKSLDCLSHSINFHFFTNSNVRFYARTTIADKQPPHNAHCTNHFRLKKSVQIDIRKQYWDYLQNHHAKASFCDGLRHDFSLAVALVHEVCHAVGVMRRGDLNEPHLRLDHLDKPELGYAWENFMFGGILNPFDRESSTISFLMRKVWVSDATAYAAGGKEWAAVPMSYIAQWFQQSTWDVIAQHGPTAVPSPVVRIKLRATQHYYVVLSDDREALADVQALQAQLIRQYSKSGRYPGNIVGLVTARTQWIDSEELQSYAARPPSRIGVRGSLSRKVVTAAKSFSKSAVVTVTEVDNTVTLQEQFQKTKLSSQLKRAADADEFQCDCDSSRASTLRPRKRVKV